ncbi:hypothetical protein AWN76_001960 [Rhodothermaceae bacterium RA]|nr:hypothetical protein AWN76_001960 [Rhodothermaceae bacterium RA]
MNRRETLKMMAMAPLGAGLSWTKSDVEALRHKTDAARASGQAFEPAFFTPHEWQTLRVLVDYIIPADDRSGSATDAGVPEFIDFTMVDRPALQTPMRGGLAWLDLECRDRFGEPFVKCRGAQQRAVLDDIAYPDDADPRFSHGVRFFTLLRDLTAGGFFSSKMGVEDLGYKGNTFVHEWTGAPPEVLQRLGVSYDDWIYRGA